MLYAQIAEGIVKLMRRAKENHVFSFLKTYNRTNLSADFFKTQLDLNLDGAFKQRDLVTFGNMIARVISFQLVLEMEGFNPQLVETTRQSLLKDIAGFRGQLSLKNDADPVVDYEVDSDWTAFAG